MPLLTVGPEDQRIEAWSKEGMSFDSALMLIPASVFWAKLSSVAAGGG